MYQYYNNNQEYKFVNYKSFEVCIICLIILI